MGAVCTGPALTGSVELSSAARSYSQNQSRITSLQEEPIPAVTQLAVGGSEIPNRCWAARFFEPRDVSRGTARGRQGRSALNPSTIDPRGFPASIAVGIQGIWIIGQ